MRHRTYAPDTDANRVAAGDARIALADLLNRVAYGGERIVLHRRGKDAAALVSVEDLRLIEALEDRIDAAAARRVLARMRRTKERRIPYEKVRRELGLDRHERRTRRGTRAG